MNDELKQIIDGGFDVVPALQALALRLLQLERDVGHLTTATGPIEDTSGDDTAAEAVAATKQRPSKKAAP